MRPLPAFALVVLLVGAPGASQAAAAPGGTPAPTTLPPDAPTAAVASATAPDAGPAPADTSRPRTTGRTVTNNTTARLEIGDDPAAGYADPAPDLGATLSASDRELRHRFQAERVRYLADQPTTIEGTGFVIGAAVQRLPERIDALRDQERDAARAYQTGTIDGRELARRLASIALDAAALESFVGALAGVIDETLPDYSFDAEGYRADLDTFQGPVRERIAGELAAREAAPVVHAAATEKGIVVGMIEDDQYVRETSRYDNRDRTGEPRIEDASTAADRVGQLYPWATDNGGRIRQIALLFEPGFFRVELSHPHGEAVTYLDQHTTESFLEIQYLDLDRVPTTRANTATNGSVELVVNRTGTDGAVLVTVRDATTGDPVPATVFVDDKPLGDTGTDGQLWAVVPEGRRTIVADADDASVAVTIGRTDTGGDETDATRLPAGAR